MRAGPWPGKPRRSRRRTPSHFQITYASETSYHFLLHLAGLSFHKPGAVDQHRAPEAEITARMNQIRHELDTSWNDPDVMIMAADEVRIEHEAILRRAWHRTGATTKLRVNRIKQAQSYIGFLHEHDGTVDLTALDWQNTNNTFVKKEFDKPQRHKSLYKKRRAF